MSDCNTPEGCAECQYIRAENERLLEALKWAAAAALDEITRIGQEADEDE